ncbi:MAG: gas vesicle protein GvpJ [Xanthobacteraceae bacterium]
MEHSLQTTNLADILERVLDKGIVIAGDITISLVEIDLLNIKLRLLIASVDKAKELGINWWETDPKLSSRADDLERENGALRQRLSRLETKRQSELIQRQSELIPSASRADLTTPGTRRSKRSA